MTVDESLTYMRFHRLGHRLMFHSGAYSVIAIAVPQAAGPAGLLIGVQVITETTCPRTLVSLIAARDDRGYLSAAA